MRTSLVNIRYIALKEIRTYFSSPMAYVVAAAFNLSIPDTGARMKSARM